METQKAVRATISLGDIPLDVFQLPDGSYKMSQSQVTNAVEKPPKRMVELSHSEAGQILIQHGFEKGLKVSVEGSKPVTMVSLKIASLFWSLELAIGNTKALALVTACSIEALERRADNAFNIKRTEDEYNQRLNARVKGKLARRTLTDCIQDYCENNQASEKYKKFIFSNCSDYLNKIILGAKSKRAKEFYSVPENSLLRNHIPVNALRELELAENLAGRFIDERNLEPLDAVKEACGVAFVKFIGLE